MGVNQAKKNIKCIVMYDGTNYDGWQRLQGNNESRSIQYVIEEKLTLCFKYQVQIHGSGRTDKGVHAISQVFHFSYEGDMTLTDIKNDMNQLLPEDIHIIEMSYANREFHSRYSAKKKNYEYRLVRTSERSVFTRKYTYVVDDSISIDNMIKASKYLIGTYDFKAFSTDRKDNKSTIRTIEEIDISEVCDSSTYNKQQIRINITGNGFLYNMVRIIVGTLVEVGERKRSPEDIKVILESKDRKLSGPTIHYEGLFLKNVEY